MKKLFAASDSNTNETEDDNKDYEDSSKGHTHSQTDKCGVSNDVIA